MATKRSSNKEYEDLLAIARTYKPIQFLSPILPMYSARDEPKKEKEPVPVNPFEPKSLEQFVGQEQAKEVIKIIVDSANKEKRLIPNILLTGAYGHGKTTLAKLIVKRHKKDVEIIDGSVAGLVIKPDRDTIYIVDEIHNVPPAVTDSFNIEIDAGNLRMIGCTTNPGALPAPFRSRFRNIYLDEYQPKHIAQIIERAAKRMSLTIEKAAINDMANRSKCNPRNALMILDFVREVAVLGKEEQVTTETVLDALKKLGIDAIGLTNLDRKYLDVINATRPVGLQYISSVLAVDSDTVQEEIEPYLIRIGLIERTPRGRIRANSSSNPVMELPLPEDILEQLKRSLETLET